jgi:hypothetical protein
VNSATERNDFYGFSVTRVTNQFEPYQERPPFLIDGILHNTMTLLYGEAKNGKSTLAAALAASLVNGEPQFLNRKIEPKDYSVGIVAADFGDDQAYADQLRQVLNDGTMVPVYALDRPPDRRVWEGLQLASRDARHDLVVVDNLTTLVDGSLNDDISVNRIYDELDRFVRDGTAVLLVAHASEKFGERGKSPYPIGSSAIRARARWLWRTERLAEVTRLTFSGNYAGSHEIITTLAEGVPRFGVLGSTGTDALADRKAARKRARSKATLDRNKREAEWWRANCQGMTQRAAAEKMSEHFGHHVDASRISRVLSKIDLDTAA